MNTIKCPHQAYGAAMPSSSLQLLATMRQAAFYGTAFFVRPIFIRRLPVLILLLWAASVSARKLDWVVQATASTDVIPGGDERVHAIVRDAAGKLLQNRPNPFVKNTTIAFILPGTGDAQLRVFDATGRLLAERNGHYPAGQSEETLEK